MSRPSLVSTPPAPVAGPAVLSRTEALAATWRQHAERQRAINPADPTAATLSWCAEQMVVAVTTASHDDEELTPAQYGAQSHVGRTGSTIRRWCQRGLLPCRMVGRDYRIRRATPVPAFAVAEDSAA